MSLLFGLENEPDKDLHDAVMGPAVLPLAIAIGAPWPMMARSDERDAMRDAMRDGKRDGKRETRMRAWCWVLGCCVLWALPLRAEVKIIPVFEAEGMVQTLKELYPELGVSAMGNQLVLSGTPDQLQEAERVLDKLNQPPQSLLIEWRVAGASSSRQAGIGIGNDNAKRRWLVEGGPRTTSAPSRTTGRCAASRGGPCCCRWVPISRSPSIAGRGVGWWA